VVYLSLREPLLYTESASTCQISALCVQVHGHFSRSPCHDEKEMPIRRSGVVNKLSVAMCTYNGAAYLPAQLESIASQTRQPDELVIGDDCSTDDTRAIIERFRARLPFPVHLHMNDRNIGSTQNFERTILRCHGDIIVLCDQDDVWLPSKLVKLEAVLDEKSDVGLVFSDADLVDENLQPLGCRLWDTLSRPDERSMFLKGRWLDVLFTRNVVTGATTAFRAEFRDLVFPVPKLTVSIHDEWIALAIGSFARLAFISEPLVLYRRHRGQQLGVDLDAKKQHLNNVLHPDEYGFAIHYYAQQVVRLNELCAALNEVRDRALAHRPVSLSAGILRTSAQNENLYAQELINHYRVRGRLSPKRFQRIWPIAHELFTGRYHSHSQGTLSAFKDLVR
jgi:glycosyltransferase involved in cell wall biosynthesis